jgi:hypothetical protein
MKGLKIMLWICAIRFLPAFIPAVIPWPAFVAGVESLGIQPPGTDEFTKIMIRLSLAGFGMVGIFFVILARNPFKYGVMLPLAAYGLVGFGIVTLVAGIRYIGLPVWTYSINTIFGVVAGVLLLIFRNKALQASSDE